MKKQYTLYILILLVSAVLLTGCTKKEDGYDTSKVKVVGSDEQGDESNQQEQQVPQEKKDDTDLGYLSDPSEFTKVKQTVGETSEGTFVIEDVADITQSGYHEIVFTVNSTGDIKVLPLVVVEPVLEKGVVRVTLNNIEKDSSGIPYQQSRDVNKGAIGGIYHAVTSKEKTSIYEVGIAGNNPFKLESNPLEEGRWSVSLKVAYDLKYSAPTMDLGSTEFSSEQQDISGMTSSDGAKVTSYSYSVSGDTLRFVFSVASGTSNPVPTVSASYDDENILNVTFESLESDKVNTWGKSITLPAGIVVDVSRSGENSVYRFGGIGGKNSFRLSASKSPNQVIVEIKLK